MTPRRLAVCLSFAMLVLSGCPCWVPAPRHSPRRMYSADSPNFVSQPLAPQTAEGPAASR